MSSFRVLLGLFGLIISLSAQAANFKTPKYFLSYEQLSALSLVDRIEYIKTFSGAVAYSEKQLFDDKKSASNGFNLPLEVGVLGHAEAASGPTSRPVLNAAVRFANQFPDKTVSNCAGLPTCGFAGNESCRVNGSCKVPKSLACDAGGGSLGIRCASYMGAGRECVAANNNASGACTAIMKKNSTSMIPIKRALAEFATFADAQKDYEGGMRVIEAACPENVSGKQKQDCDMWKKNLAALKRTYCSEQKARNLSLCTDEEIEVLNDNWFNDKVKMKLAGGCNNSAIGYQATEEDFEFFSGKGTGANALTESLRTSQISCSCSGPQAKNIMPALAKHVAGQYCDMIKGTKSKASDPISDGGQVE